MSSSSLLLLAPLRRLFERSERAAPELIEVLPNVLQPRRVHLIQVARAPPCREDEPGLLQHLQVLGDGRSRDGEIARDLRDRARAVDEAFKDRSAGGIAQGGKGARNVSHY